MPDLDAAQVGRFPGPGLGVDLGGPVGEVRQRTSKAIQDVLGEESFATNLSKDDLEYLSSED